jgi:AraC-like DNA-binding protein
MDEMQRWEILRLHIEDGITLTDLARSAGISTRTLSRWAARYRAQTESTVCAPPHDPMPGPIAYPRNWSPTSSTSGSPGHGHRWPPCTAWRVLPSTATIGETTQLRHGAWHHPSA